MYGFYFHFSSLRFKKSQAQSYRVLDWDMELFACFKSYRLLRGVAAFMWFMYGFYYHFNNLRFRIWLETAKQLQVSNTQSLVVCYFPLCKMFPCAILPCDFPVCLQQKTTNNTVSLTCCVRFCVRSAFFWKMFKKTCRRVTYWFCKHSPYKTSNSPSQPGGVPPSAAGLRWIVKKSAVCAPGEGGLSRAGPSRNCLSVA